MKLSLRQSPGFYSNMLRLALPIVLQNLITESLALVDTFMVGMLGEDQLAGVTTANIPIFVVALMAFGIQSGSTVLISQYWGKRDEEAVNRVMGVALYVAVVLTGIFAAGMFFFAEPFMNLFCNEPAVAHIAAGYGRIAGFSYVLNAVDLVYIAVQRAMGNSQLGLKVLSVSMAANVFFNWVFIFGRLGAPQMGAAGAALGTLVARCLEFVLIWSYALWNKRFRLRFRSLLRPGKAMLIRFLRYATPVVFNETLWGLGTALYPTIMGHMEGSQAILAAYSVAGNVQNVCVVAVGALAASTAILVGQAVGAGEVAHAKSIGTTLSLISILMGAVIGAVVLVLVYTLAPTYLYPVVNLSQAAARAATIMMTVLFVTLPLRSFNSVQIVGVLRGGGDVNTATLIDLLPLWVVALPLAALAGLVLRLDILWVYLALASEQVVKATMGILRIRSGRWVKDVTVQ